MIVVNAYGVLRSGTHEKALAASRKNKANAHSEPGCERFDFFFSPDEPNRFVFVEEWTTRADLDNHFSQTTFAEFMATISECIEGPPDIRIFEAEMMA